VVLPPKLGTFGIDAQRRTDLLRWSVHARAFNFAGQPAITLPLFSSEQHFAVGIQLGAAVPSTYRMDPENARHGNHVGVNGVLGDPP